MNTSAPSRRLILGTFAALPLTMLPSILPAGAAAPADTDTVVVQLADKIAAIHSESERLFLIEESLPSFRERDRWSETHIRPLTNQYLELLETLVTTPATTPAGFRAKARVWLIHGNCAPGYAAPHEGEALAWSLANDVLGIESVWRQDDAEDFEEEEVVPHVRGPEQKAQEMLNAVAFMWTKVMEAMAEPGSLLTLDRIREVLPIADDLVVEDGA